MRDQALQIWADKNGACPAYNGKQPMAE